MIIMKNQTTVNFLMYLRTLSREEWVEMLDNHSVAERLADFSPAQPDKRYPSERGVLLLMIHTWCQPGIRERFIELNEIIERKAEELAKAGLITRTPGCIGELDG